MIAATIVVCAALVFFIITAILSYAAYEARERVRIIILTIGAIVCGILSVALFCDGVTRFDRIENNKHQLFTAPPLFPSLNGEQDVEN